MLPGLSQEQFESELILNMCREMAIVMLARCDPEQRPDRNRPADHGNLVYEYMLMSVKPLNSFSMEVAGFGQDFHFAGMTMHAARVAAWMFDVIEMAGNGRHRRFGK